MFMTWVDKEMFCPLDLYIKHSLGVTSYFLFFVVVFSWIYVKPDAVSIAMSLKKHMSHLYST